MEDNKVVQGQQEDFADEMREAQKTGIVSMEDKKKEKKNLLMFNTKMKKQNKSFSEQLKF